MNNPRLAGRYAKSLLDLAVEQNQLEVVFADMKLLKQVCSGNPDFVALLKSPIISSDKKLAIIDAILKDKISKLTHLIVRLLTDKSRENRMPEIVNAFIEQYNVLNHIYKVKITTASELSSDLESFILNKIRTEKNIEKLEVEKEIDESLIGGFKMQMGDLLVDASILRDLLDVKKQFENNDYIRQIR